MAKRLPHEQYKDGRTLYCFKCDQLENVCTCEGGFKVCFLRGVPMSIDEVNAQPRYKSPREIMQQFEDLKEAIRRIEPKKK